MLIDHLVVCTFSHIELRSHKQGPELGNAKLYRRSGQKIPLLSLQQTFMSVNNSQQLRHSCLPVLTDKSELTAGATVTYAQVKTNKNLLFG